MARSFSAKLPNSAGDLHGNEWLFRVKTFGFLTALAGTGFSVSLCGIGLGIYLAGVLIQLVTGGEYDWRPYPFARLIVPLLGCLIVSLFVSDYFWLSLRGLGKYLQGFVLLYAGLDLMRTPVDARRFVFVLAGVYGAVILAALWQDVFGADFVRFRAAIPYDRGLPRLTGPFKHYNDFGTFLVPAFGVAAACFMHAVHRRPRAAVLPAVLFVLLAYVLARSLSRGALLSVFATLVVLSLFYRGRWIGLGLLAGLLMGLWFSPWDVGERLRELLTLEVGSMRERILLLQISFDMLRESPFFGLGLNTYSMYFPDFRPPEYQGLMYTHNTYAQMAAEAGLLSLSFYVLFIGALLFRFGRGIVLSRPSFERALVMGLVAGLAGLLVNGLFESVLQSTQIRTLFWILAGTAAGLAYNAVSGETR